LFVKVCCIQDLDEARLAISAGASAIGLVSAMPSGPGPIGEAQIVRIAAAVPAPIETFLLTALCEAEGIAEQHCRCGTTAVYTTGRTAGASAKLREFPCCLQADYIPAMRAPPWSACGQRDSTFVAACALTAGWMQGSWGISSRRFIETTGEPT
jgi:hypothetical protein